MDARAFSHFLTLNAFALLLLFLVYPSVTSAQRFDPRNVVWCDGVRYYGECPRAPSRRSTPDPQDDYNREHEYRMEREREQEAERERERRRQEQVAKEEAEKKKKEQEQFEKRRAEAVSSLKGAGTASPTLKGADPNVGGNTPSYGLKGVTRDEARSEIRPLPTGSGQSNPTAWAQLHCSASIAKYGLEAALKGDYLEQRYLFNEVFKALNGAKTSVVCDPAPPFPALRGRSVDLDRLRNVQHGMIERAGVIAARMEQRETSLPRETRDALRIAQSAPPPGNRPETNIERLRRIQAEINRINSTKIDGNTVEVIRQQEKDRTEIVKTVLINEKIQNGNLDLGIDLSADTGSRRRRSEVPAPH